MFSYIIVKIIMPTTTMSVDEGNSVYFSGLELSTSPHTSKYKGGLVNLLNNYSSCLLKVNVSSTPPCSSQ